MPSSSCHHAYINYMILYPFLFVCVYGWLLPYGDPCAEVPRTLLLMLCGHCGRCGLSKLYRTFDCTYCTDLYDKLTIARITIVGFNVKATRTTMTQHGILYFFICIFVSSWQR
ncbi:hypothetical protein F5884DRAFT_478914 [Xylogone sp. PMI_703]|nr:hypothetical protein F5884DRAFT_478914 [Xylogone sp. PMI_703]